MKNSVSYIITIESLFLENVAASLLLSWKAARCLFSALITTIQISLMAWNLPGIMEQLFGFSIYRKRFFSFFFIPLSSPHQPLAAAAAAVTDINHSIMSLSVCCQCHLLNSVQKALKPGRRRPRRLVANGKHFSDIGSRQEVVCDVVFVPQASDSTTRHLQVGGREVRMRLLSLIWPGIQTSNPPMTSCD